MAILLYKKKEHLALKLALEYLLRLGASAFALYFGSNPGL